MMQCLTAWPSLLTLSVVLLGGTQIAGGYPLESPNVKGTATGVFHIEVIGNRVWFVAPDGNGIFPRAVDALDANTSGGNYRGAFRAYSKDMCSQAAAARSTSQRRLRTLIRRMW